MKPLVIAIDGPAGAGKSTVAQKLAERLGLPYVDSGATYRAAALAALRAGVEPDDEQAVEALIGSVKVEFLSGGSGPSVLLNREDVTAAIRRPEVALAASKVSRFPAVRQKMVELQRQLAAERGAVMEGRDIGTVVFPQADLKVFLTADTTERARRRLNDDQQRGNAVGFEQTVAAIKQRDQLDRAREHSPLVAAPDAVTMDSTELTADQVVDKIVELARGKNLTAEE